jgi:phosphate/sulfate permease
MQRVARKGVSISVTILMFFTALGAYIASGFAIRSIPVLVRSDTNTLIRIDFIIPAVALWIAYCLIFHVSAYLRPRTSSRYGI